MKSTTIYTFVIGLALVVIAGLATAGLAGPTQNSNSSSASATTKPKPQHPKTAAAKAVGRCDNTKQEQTDLSGTYTGKLKHGDAPVMDATLTITGNDFTGTMGSET